MCDLVADALRAEGHEVFTTTQSSQALAELRVGDFNLVVTDLNLDDGDGLSVCREVVSLRPDTPVIVITAFGTMEAAIAAIRAGAYDFVNKPFDVRNLLLMVNRGLEHARLRREVKRLREGRPVTGTVGQLIGQCRQMRRVYDLVRRVAENDASVVIGGESGTGKELVARAIHGESARRAAPFVAINCGAVSEGLLESELFGHVKGAFTDAHGTRKGLFEQADGGTLFLDEIGETPPEMQVKLLRVLQERTVRPVGGNSESPVDVRIVAASNRDLQQEVEEGRFREDLYYRLNVVQIELPPLRARGNDILLLGQYFIGRVAKEFNKSVTGLTPEAAKKLLEYDWPGNVRQLENCIERAMTLTRFDQIGVEDLPDRIQQYRSTETRVDDVDIEHLPTLADLERRYIEKVLRLSKNNKTQAARVLGVDRRTLYRKLDRLD
jgi:two-component system response regulator HydG